MSERTATGVTVAESGRQSAGASGIHGTGLRSEAAGKTVFFLCVLLVVLSSAPVLSFYLGAGGDLQFHLCRIEAIRQALSTGQFPVRISGYWCGGYGYASSVLYGELFLYAPAVLRIIGFSPQDAYKFYLLAVNVFTCFSAYYCLKKMLGERLSAFVGTAVYMLAPYRLSTLHLRAAVGEYTAMAFMPFIIYGLYLIYGRRRGWQWLALGFSGLIQCHVISTFMAGIFTALICLVRIRQTLSKEVLLQFVRAVVCTVLINAWFLLPFLEYIGFDYNVSGLGVHSRGRFASHAVFVSQLISFFPQGEGASIVTGKMWDTDNGMEMSYTLGGGMMLVLVFFVVYRLYDKRRGKRTVCGSDAPKKAGRQMSRLLTGACLLSMLMATTWFPWDFLQQRNDLFAWVTGSIQFPWRFLTISTVAGAFAAAFFIFELRRGVQNHLVFYGVLLSVGFLTLLSADYFLQDYEKKSEPGYTTAYEIDSWWLGCAEYMPTGTDETTFYGDGLQGGEGLSIEGFERAQGRVRVCCENAADREISLDVPVLYYKGYAARDVDTGQRLDVLPAGNMRVRVMVPAGYRGTFDVRFESPWYWRAGEVISCMTAILLILFWVKNKRGQKKVWMQER